MKGRFDLKRSEWIDSCRFFAIFVIMVTHFIAAVKPDVLLLWESPPSSWLLYGLTGKFSVAFFFVLLGYFASKPEKFNPSSFASYALRRYLQFSFYIFLCTIFFIGGSYIVTWLFHTPESAVLRVISDGFRYNIIYLLKDALLFEDNYNATLWCMQQLFTASLICKCFAFIPEIISRYFRTAIALFVILLLMIIDASFFVWVCAGIMGYILRLVLEQLNEMDFSHDKALALICFVLALVLIKYKLEEGILQYSLQSVAAFLLILAQFQMPSVQKLLSCSPLPWLGGISMGLFVAHTPINELLFSSIYPLLQSIISDTAAQFICFIISLAACIFTAWFMGKVFLIWQKLFTKETAKV